MTSSELDTSRRAATLHDYVAIVRRRKWAVLGSIVLVLGAALIASSLQPKLYQSEAEVLLSRQNLAAMLTNTQDPTINVQAERFAETQARLAQVPVVAERVLKDSAAPGWDASQFLEQSSVQPQRNSDLLLFTVRAASPSQAKQLTTSYAREFTRYRRELDTAALTRARDEVRSRLAQLRSEGEQKGALYNGLVDKDQQLSTLQTLQTSNAFVVHPADQAQLVQPRFLRNAIFGVLFGALLGLGIAFLWDALDTRVRRPEEISEALGLPLLGYLAAPPKRLERENRLVTLAEPESVHAEAFRLLRMNLRFARLDQPVKTIAITSAIQGEGKSVTASNLAVTLARGGQQVILVDLDLRRPRIGTLFQLDGPGVTNVALNQATLDDALVSIDLDAGLAAPGATSSHGSLHVLPAGFTPAVPGEFLGTKRLSEILSAIGERADMVLIDTPPIMRVGDALALSTRVDGLLFLARVDALRRPMLPEIRRLLDAAPVTKIGVVIASASDQTGTGYYGYGYAADDSDAPRGAPDAYVAERETLGTRA